MAGRQPEPERGGPELRGFYPAPVRKACMSVKSILQRKALPLLLNDAGVALGPELLISPSYPRGSLISQGEADGGK